jgi:hypothetical protein
MPRVDTRAAPVTGEFDSRPESTGESYVYRARAVPEVTETRIITDADLGTLPALCLHRIDDVEVQVLVMQLMLKSAMDCVRSVLPKLKP